MLIAVIVMCVLLAAALAVGVMIYLAQKRIDAPYGGVLVVEKVDGEPTNIYLGAVTAPDELQDRQTLRVLVRVKDGSQG